MQNNLLVIFLTSLLCFIPIGSCDTPEGPDYYSLVPGDKLPEFSVVCNDGSTLTTEMLRGKKSLIVFFSTTCPDCWETLPKIQEAYDKNLQEGITDVVYICISRGEGNDIVSKYWKENNLTLPYSAQTTREVYELFTNYNVPKIFVSDSDLIIQEVYE